MRAINTKGHVGDSEAAKHLVGHSPHLVVAGQVDLKQDLLSTCVQRSAKAIQARATRNFSQQRTIFLADLCIHLPQGFPKNIIG